MPILKCLAIVALFIAVCGPQQCNAATLTVTNTADSGAGSLRQAILDANATPEPDTIEFDIPTALNANGYHHIHPMSEYPLIVYPLVVDGTTEPDYVGTPVIQLHGRDAGQANGFYFGPAAAGSGVRGLDIWYFSGSGVYIAGDNQFVEDCSVWECYDGIHARRVTGASITDNYLYENYYSGLHLIQGGGHTVSGNLCEDNQHGTVAYNSPDNLFDGNIFRYNLQFGAWIQGQGSLDNTLSSNLAESNGDAGFYVAVGSTGTDLIGNTATLNNRGIVLSGSYQITVNGNLVENNASRGIVVSTHGASVSYNAVSGHPVGIYVYGNDNQGVGNEFTDNDVNVVIGGGTGNSIE